MRVQKPVIALVLLGLFGFAGCGDEQPLLENPGEAIIIQMLPPVVIAPEESLLLWVNVGNVDTATRSYLWTAKNSRGEDVTEVVFSSADASTPEEDTPAEEPVVQNRDTKVRFSTAEPGAYLITVTVTGQDGKQATASTILEVVAENSPPQLDETDAITIDPVGPYVVNRDIFLTAQAVDPEGGRLSYTWSIKDQTNQEVSDGLESNTGPTVKFTPQIAGSYLVTVTVADDRDAQERASILVIVVQ